MIQDMYSANLGWHPSELPSFDVYYTRRYLYDAQRTTQDIQTDNYTWSSDYRSIKGLELDYNGNYNTVKDNLRSAQTESLTNSGHIAYSGTLLNNRVFYHSSYNISMQQTTVTNSGSIQTLALTQLFSTTPNPNANPPTTVTNGQLNAFQTINLVAPLTLPATQNNLGLRFFNPTTQVNTLFLSINTKDKLTQSNIIPSITDLNNIFNSNPHNKSVFSFDVYTSSDGLTWSLQPAPTVTVGNNPTLVGSDEVGFIISFQTLTAQFIKVVQTPDKLTPPIPINSIDQNNILVVSVQASREVQVTPGTSIKSSTIGGIYDMNVKALLLDNPNLSYDMTFTFTHNKSDQTPLATTYQFNNGLSVSRRLGEIWTVNGRVTEELSSDAQSKMRNAFSYNAGVSVTPLPTLNHSLVYGGRIEFFEGQTTMTNSIYLNNSAELYRGLSVNLGTGYSTGTQASGQSSDSVSLTVGTGDRS